MEMCQKGIKDQRMNEKEVRLLKEKNKELKERLNITEREEQSLSRNHTYNQERTTTTQTHTQ